MSRKTNTKLRSNSPRLVSKNLKTFSSQLAEWFVRDLLKNKSFRVKRFHLEETSWTCSCEDFRKDNKTCKHIMAVQNQTAHYLWK